MSRSFRDRYDAAVHHAGEVRRNGGPLSVEQLRKIGLTPKGFKSSRPKAER